MSLSENGLSPADVVALNGNNNDLFGGNGSWFIIILFLFAIMSNGWGNGYGNGAGGVSENYTLISDMGQLERKIDTVNGGVCNGFYSTAQLINGVNMQNATNTASLQNTLTQGFAGLNTGMVQQGYESRIATQGIGQQMQQCCCDLRQQVSDVNYNIATQANGITNAVNSGFCQTNYNNSNNTRDILEAQNANTRAILDALNANKVEALKDRIAEQNQQINALQLSASQMAQNSYIVDTLSDKLSPCPRPSYLVCNPNAPLNYSVVANGCGCNA